MITMSNNELSREFFRKALNFQINGKNLEAVINYKISLQLEPSPITYTHLASVIANEGKYKEAIDYCKLAIELDKNFGAAYTDIGYYLLKLGDIENSILYLTKAIRLLQNDEKYKAYYYLGKIYSQKSEWTKAISSYKDSLRFKPDFQPAKNEFYKLIASMN